MATAVHVPPMTLHGIQRVGPSSFNSTAGSGADFAAALWHEFIGELIRVEVPLDGAMYGVSWPADTSVPPQQVHYFCGTQIDGGRPGLEELRVDGGNYLEFRCEVPADDLDSGFREAYMSALPASGLTPREGQHLEVYGDDYDPNAPIAKFRILIPVE